MPRIGSGADLVPGRVRGIGVEMAHRVCDPGQAQRERGHVELRAGAVGSAAELEDPVDGHAARVRAPITLEERAGDATDELRVEALVAGRDRGVDREHAVRADAVPGLVEDRALRHGLARPLAQQERRVAFVQVPDRGLDPEPSQRPNAADAEDELLVKPHLAAADVEDVRDRPVGPVVLRLVGVEEQHRHAADLCQVDGDVDVAAGQLDLDVERLALDVDDALHRQALEVVVGIGVLLVAVRVDRLAEVALAVEEADRDERQRHVAGLLGVIAREDAEAARIDAERLIEAVLGAEVGDRASRARSGCLPLEPVVGPVRHVLVEVRHDVAVLGHEMGIGEQLVPRDRARQDGDRAAVPLPGDAVDPAEQFLRGRMPGPPEVVGESAQSLELRRQPECGDGKRRDVEWLHVSGASYRRHLRCEPVCVRASTAPHASARSVLRARTGVSALV